MHNFIKITFAPNHSSSFDEDFAHTADWITLFDRELSPVEMYVATVLSRTFRDGNYRLITRGGAWFPTTEMDLPCMQWLVYGWNLCEVEQLLTKDHFTHGGRQSSKLFGELGHTVMPKFGSSLDKFLATFEIKMKTIDHVRTKALAGMVSVAIAGAQVVGNMVWSRLKEEV